MKILSDTLEPVIERWDDPGDYPSGAGSGPLASYNYVADVAGEIVLELEASDFLEGWEGVEYDLPHGIKVKKWAAGMKDAREGRIVLTVTEFDAGEVERDCPEPDYDDVGD